VFALNPKCVKLGELYGETDPNTFEWSDGLIATATRKFARSHEAPVHGHDAEQGRPTSSSTVMSAVPSELSDGNLTIDSVPTVWKWVVLDGPVDTIWVENLNTVLDDSKVRAEGQVLMLPIICSGPVSLRFRSSFPSTFHIILGANFPPKCLSETGPRSPESL
jgi:hypothetical protein